MKGLVNGKPDQIDKSFFSRTKATEFLAQHGIQTSTRPEETEQRQLNQDDRYSETDKDDPFLHASENLCKLKNDMDAVYLHDLMAKRLGNKHE